MDTEMNNNQKPSLFERLGGEPGLRELVDDIIDRVADNPFLEYYFHDVDRGLVKILAYEYFSTRAGGPDQYTGPDLHSTFYSLNVRPEEFDYLVEDALYILDLRNIDSEERSEFMAILESMRPDIVRANTYATPAYH